MTEIYAEPDDDGMYAWEDETGLQYYGSEDELDAWAAENGYQDVPRAPYTPDTPGEYGVRDRDLWPTDPTERKAAREAAFRTMYEERRIHE